MCRQVACRKCNGVTWAGCGMHVEETLRGVPKNRLCKCDSEPAGNNQPTGGFFSRLFGN